MTHNHMFIDTEVIRKDFPILNRRINGKPIIYFDNAVTSQKPTQVIRALETFYRTYYANTHRGIYKLSIEATNAYEDARTKVAKFINAKDSAEIIFVRGTTEAINLVSHTWGRSNIGKGEQILLSEMEHHSNLVPWQLLAKERNANLSFVGINSHGYLEMNDFQECLERKTRLVSISHVSNVLGTINPMKGIIRESHENGATVLVDAAQSVPHMPVDVQELDCDFLAFSGHKMLAPTGIGVLYGKKKILEEMVPFITGGQMIKEVHFNDAIWNDLPWKFEAGTSSIGDAIGLGVAVDYLSRIGMDNVRSHEKELTQYALEKMKEVKSLNIYGPNNSECQGGVISFNLGDIHAHDLATILDEEGIAIRAGHHCAMPLMERLNVPATARISFYIYNTFNEVDVFLGALRTAEMMFGI